MTPSVDQIQKQIQERQNWEAEWGRVRKRPWVLLRWNPPPHLYVLVSLSWTIVVSINDQDKVIKKASKHRWIRMNHCISSCQNKGLSSKGEYGLLRHSHTRLKSRVPWKVPLMGDKKGSDLSEEFTNQSCNCQNIRPWYTLYSPFTPTLVFLTARKSNCTVPLFGRTLQAW